MCKNYDENDLSVSRLLSHQSCFCYKKKSPYFFHAHKEVHQLWEEKKGTRPHGHGAILSLAVHKVQICLHLTLSCILWSAA